MKDDDAELLILDEIYESSDPHVKESMQQFMQEEMEAAHERALIRLACKFRHLLKPSMQALLGRRYPNYLMATG